MGGIQDAPRSVYTTAYGRARKNVGTRIHWTKKENKSRKFSETTRIVWAAAVVRKARGVHIHVHLVIVMALMMLLSR